MAVDANELANAVARLEYLNDLNSYLAFPMSTGGIQDTFLPRLHEMYGDFPPDRGESYVPPVVTLARRLNVFVDADLEFGEQSVVRLMRRLHRSRPLPALGKLGILMWQQVIQERAMIYDLAFLLNEGVGAWVLLDAAQYGDEEALLKLVKVDKSILGAPWAAAQLEQRQCAGDWAFFRRLGDRVRRPPIDKGAGYAREVLIVALFWEEHFRHCTLEETVKLLAPHFPALEGAMDSEPFRKQLIRAGLKKPRYNRKVGQLE